MAVRHLKRYASWVQTVQHLIRDDSNGVLHGLNPRGIVRYVETYCAKTYLRRSRAGMHAKKSTDIGEIQSRCVREDNTKGIPSVSEVALRD